MKIADLSSEFEACVCCHPDGVASCLRAPGSRTDPDLEDSLHQAVQLANHGWLIQQFMIGSNCRAHTVGFVQFRVHVSKHRNSPLRNGGGLTGGDLTRTEPPEPDVRAFVPPGLARRGRLGTAPVGRNLHPSHPSENRERWKTPKSEARNMNPSVLK